MAIASDVDAALRRQAWQQVLAGRTGSLESIYYGRARELRAQAFASFFHSLGRIPAAVLKPLRRLMPLLPLARP